MENAKWIWPKRMATVTGAYIFTLSLNEVIKMWKLSAVFYGVGLFGYNIWAVGLFLFAAWIIHRMLRRNDKRLHIVSGITGLVLSLLFVYGSFTLFQNNIFQSAEVTRLQICMMAGFFPAVMACAEEVLLLFDKLPAWYNRKEEKEWAAEVFFRKHKAAYFFVVWLAVFLSFMPIFLGCWPGNFAYDAPAQMVQVLTESYNTHHPLLHTFMMGWAYNFGAMMGDVSNGYQLYTLAQMLLLSGAFAYCVYYLFLKKAARAWRLGVLLWFCWFPMHAMFAISSTKDVPFAAFFLIFMIYLIRLLYDREQFKWYSYMGLIGSGVFCVLMRNNAVYAILAGGLILILFEKGGWKPKLRIASLLVAIYVIGNVTNTGMALAVNAENTDRYRESMTATLQSLGRVAAYRRDDLDDALYREICMYIDEEAIASYNPYLADLIKDAANEELLRENLLNYFKLWVKVGLQFPDEYIESFLANTMAYWYVLDMAPFTANPVDFFHNLIWLSDVEQIEKRGYFDLAGEFYGDLFWQEKVRETPVLGYLFRIDGWVWFLNFYFLWCIYRKSKKAGLMGAVPFMYMATCYLGPIPILRYIYCIIVLIPLLLHMVMRHNENREMAEETVTEETVTEETVEVVEA